MKKMIEFWLYYIWKLQIQIGMRPRWDWVKLKQTRWDRDETVWKFFIRDKTTSKMLYETGRRPRVSVLLVSRPRLSPISVCKPVGQLWCYKLLSTVHSWKRWFFLRFCAIFHQMSFFFCGKAKHFFFIFYCMRQELDLWTDWPSLTRDISV